MSGPIEYGIGFGDTYLFNGPRYFRQWQGIDDPNLQCSVSYQAGAWSALAFQAAEGGVGLYRGGLALLTNAPRGARVFWSGRTLATDAAANYARATGGATLEMTSGGRAMTWAEPYLPKWLANPLWRDLSGSFARGASGSVDVFQNGAGIGINSTWATVEYGTLVRNGVRINYHVVFP